MQNFQQYDTTNTKGQAYELLCGIEDQYGFLPNVFSYMIESPITVQAYLQLNQLTQHISLSDKEIQLAMLTVSMENQCHFCLAAHKTQAIKSGVSKDTINALLENKKIEDKQEAALASLLQSLVRKRGFIDHTEMDEFIEAGYTKKQIFECILIVTLKTLSNYSNHITNPDINPEITN